MKNFVYLVKVVTIGGHIETDKCFSTYKKALNYVKTKPKIPMWRQLIEKIEVDIDE